MSDPKTVIDIVRLPFKLAKRITSPVADAVGTMKLCEAVYHQLRQRGAER